MDCKKTIIDYLEGRIKPAELEELFETHPELLDWVQSIVPEDQRMEAGEFVNGHYESRTVPFDIRLFIKQCSEAKESIRWEFELIYLASLVGSLRQLFPTWRSI